MRLRFLDVEANPGPRRPVTDVCRILCSNVLGLTANHSDLTVASSQYDILLCSETLVSDMRHVSAILVPGFGRPVLLCRGKMPRAQAMAHTYEMVTEHFTNPNLIVVVAKCRFFWVCDVRQDLYVFSLYRNPVLDDRIFGCLLASMAAVQTDDIRFCPLYFG